MNMSNQMKAMLKSWAGSFMAAAIAALIVILGDGTITVDDCWYILVAGLVAVLPVIKNYFDKSYKNYGKGTVE
jgi:hypothetical protein